MKTKKQKTITNDGTAESIEEPTEPTETQLIEVQELLNELPEEMLVSALSRNPDDKSTIRIQQAIQKYSGPLPPPSMLEGFNKVQPGFAERVVSMTEREQAHRHQLENRAVQGAIDKDTRSQRYAFAVVIFLGCLCAGLIFAGHDMAGSVLGGTTLVGVVTLFITGKRTPKLDSDESKSS